MALKLVTAFDSTCTHNHFRMRNNKLITISSHAANKCFAWSARLGSSLCCCARYLKETSVFWTCVLPASDPIFLKCNASISFILWHRLNKHYVVHNVWNINSFSLSPPSPSYPLSTKDKHPFKYRRLLLALAVARSVNLSPQKWRRKKQNKKRKYGRLTRNYNFWIAPFRMLKHTGR